jgi:membrane protein DedA with SNARE-associated domain
MFEFFSQVQMAALVKDFEELGVFVAMFLESSIVPLPSEVIVAGAGALGIPIISIVIFGSLGSTLGGIVGYLLGRYAAMPVILRFGKFILIKPHHIAKAEAFAKKYGIWSVLIGRVIPIVPFKVFSIAAGITKIPLVPFIICTLIGVIPRMYILGLFGSSILRYKKPAMVIFLFIVIVFLAWKITQMIYNGKKTKNAERGS